MKWYCFIIIVVYITKIGANPVLTGCAQILVIYTTYKYYFQRTLSIGLHVYCVMRKNIPQSGSFKNCLQYGLLGVPFENSTCIKVLPSNITACKYFIAII